LIALTIATLNSFNLLTISLRVFWSEKFYSEASMIKALIKVPCSVWGWILASIFLRLWWNLWIWANEGLVKPDKRARASSTA
jgi:hypothetical protein